MKLVRIATPGMIRRMRSTIRRKISPLAPRFIRRSTEALACCRGMSRYGQRLLWPAIVSSSLLDTRFG